MTKNKKTAQAADSAEKTESNAGCPTKYKPEFCKRLIDHMSMGYSFESFAPHVDVHRDTLYEWVKVHPEFSDAKKIAFDKNLLFWETQGIEGLYTETIYDEDGNIQKTKSINSTIWIFNMKNRHAWRDRQKDESDVVVNNFSALSDEDIEKKIQEKIKALEGKE
jgi:hypothetical protein